VRAAGVRQFGGAIETLELPEPRALRSDEVLIEVRACGVGNWDNFARTGDWDLGVRPPMALGVEVAGIVAAVGDRVDGINTGDRVTAHSAPLREQGGWAEQFIAAAEEVAAVSGASQAMKAVRDAGRLATITSDPPPADRGITVQAVLVTADGKRLGNLVQLLAQGVLTVRVGEQFPLGQAAAALAQVRHGAHGAAVVLQP
jgi:NADPH:quinone reductase-like Zn-dependent oxidoreductase